MRSTVFDGNNKTICGLYLNEQKDYSSFVAINYGIIKNLSNADSYFYGGSNAGCVYSFNSNTITNYYNSGFIKGNDYVGGICGDNSKVATIISNCNNNFDFCDEDNNTDVKILILLKIQQQN